ncbi:MAG TPA: FAD/NAD(P)-binding oxidoreductase, partial [Microbacteriaceae bacterium]|nr:FAD/NAD(P)-binding oxidoreductase [Microbacteriaceae bacterium]
NPRAGNETTLVLPPSRLKKTVAVVGGGVAGLAAASAAAERGLQVTLFEARDSLGGQFDMAMLIPGKEEFVGTLHFYEGELKRHGVEVKLGAHVQAADLQHFDEVIVATGVQPRIPNIKGVELPNVVTYAQVIRGERRVGNEVAILGAGGIGFDTAEFLTQHGASIALDKEKFKKSWGVVMDTQTRGNVVAPQLEQSRRKVTMLQRKSTKAGAGLGLTTGWIHRAEVERRGVVTIVGVNYEEITPKGVHITVEGQPRFISADTIVLCTGQESLTDLYDELKALGINAHLIGGAKLASELDAKRAIYEGVEVAATF